MHRMVKLDSAAGGGAATPWYLSGGIAKANCIAAYKAIGAASAASSYVNLAKPGTYDLTVPDQPPTFDTLTGWTSNGSNQYFDTGITPADARTWTVLVRFSDALGGANGYVFGYFNNPNGFLATPGRSGAEKWYNGVAAYQVAATVAGGVIGVAGNTAYLDGVSAGAITTAATSAKMYLMGSYNGVNGVHTVFGGKIQAAVFYDSVLTLAQVEAVTAAMAFFSAVPDFSLVVLPDTQDLVVSNQGEISAIANWIVTNRAALKIGAVLHEGDQITNNESAAEYDLAEVLFDNLDGANIPYLMAIGNHDYEAPQEPRDTTLWNTYYPQARYTSKNWWSGGFYEANHSENAYLILGDYLYLALEFGPRQAVIDWAKTIVQANPTKRVLILTHSNEYIDGSLVTTGDQANPHDYYTSDTHDGTEMWAELTKLYANIFWVQSGHHINGSAKHEGTGDGGNKVLCSLANYQGMTPVSSKIRLLEFYSGGNFVLARTYSPVTKLWSYTAADSFAVAYP